MKIGPAVELRPLQDLVDLFGFSPAGAQEFLQTLGVPLHDYPDGPRFLRFALELALFRMHLKDTGLGATLNAHRDYKAYIPLDDKELSLMMTLSAIMYGSTDDTVFRQRIKLLGDQLMSGALKQGRMWKWKKNKPGLRNSKRGNVAKTVREIRCD